MKLKSIRLKNFRCFDDTKDIELKPLTIFVGANSSGKSSVLKFFPLLKHSIKDSLDGILKWNNEDLDFRDFENTVINHDKCKSIEFDLSFEKNDGGSFVIKESIGYDTPTKNKINYFNLVSQDENAYYSITADYSNNKLLYESKSDSLDDTIEYSRHSQNLIPNLFYRTKLASLLKPRVDKLTSIAQEEFENLEKNIYYMQPLRLDIQRRYALDDNEESNRIYSNATNLAYYLNNLTYSDKEELNNWLETNGFDITIDFDRLSAQSNGGMLEIYIKAQVMKISRNIIDLGFGFSQMLPIIILMWDSIKKVNQTGYRDNQYSKIVVIEQPEVHLHPKYIGKFATMVINTIRVCKEKQIPISFVVETHSDSLLNKVGDLVRDGEIPNNDINLLIFNQKDNGISDIKHIKFETDGTPEDWPVDFFDVD